MCILFLYLNDKPDQCPYKLIVASNRDEYWDRPTDKAAFRGDQQQWIGGIDLEPGREGGTWLGMSKTGKFGVLLNILDKQKPGAKGRGQWVTDFVQNNESCEEYMQTVAASMEQCNAFQFLCTDLSKTPARIHYISNNGKTDDIPRKFSSGIYSFDNSSNLDKPWKKSVAGKEIFRKIVSECNSLTEKEKIVNSLIDLLSDKTQYCPDPQLAKQFEEVGKPVDIELMQKRSAVHVWSTNHQYVTRTNTIILVDFNGNCDYYERTLETPVDCEHPKYSSVSFQFKLEPRSKLC